MKFDKQLAIILILLSMLLSAIAISVYFYNQSQETIKKNNQLVVIYVAKENIPKDTLIEKKHIVQTTIARQFLLTKPLLEKEIIGKFAKEPIYKNEAFLKEKLTEKIEKKKVNKDFNYKYNSYNMSLDLFQNPNYSLQPDDIIKIITVYPSSLNRENNDFQVQYIAKNIRVVGFMRDGYPSDKSIIKKKIKKIEKKQQVEEIVDIKADEIILDIKQDTLISLIEHYYKGKNINGKQLWMVKSKLEEESDKDAEKKKEEKKIKEIVVAKKAKKKYIPKKKYYPVKWYQPKNEVSTKTATISYANNKELQETKKAKIISNYAQECSKKDKLLMVVSNSTKLKKKPSHKAKTHKTLYKNYVVAYKSVSKINPSWYLICDDSYINSEDVVITSYDEYIKLK
jgi:hypothetical protein